MPADASVRVLDPESQRRLDAFLVDNEELEALKARLARFNLFNVLKIDRAEIRHSNVLAWLLTPGESHGLGDVFLRRFLSRLLMENDGIDIALTPAQFELMNFADVEVLREWQNIDILVRSYAGNWCLLIENKIGSKEKKGALPRYRESVEEDMPATDIIPVLLTLEGEDPSEAGREAGFVPWSHVEVLDLAERITEQHADRIPADASVFLKHYLSTLRRLTMQDEKLINLCKTIYRRHREAIELIVEYGVSSGVSDAITEEIKSHVDCEFVIPRGGGVWFLPTEMGKHLPAPVELSGWPFLPRNVPVVWWFQYGRSSGRLGLILEVGPIASGSARNRFLKAIERKGFSVPEHAYNQGRKNTRILSKFQKLRLDEDGEPSDDSDYIREVAASLWETLWSEGAKITDVLKRFDWGKAG